MTNFHSFRIFDVVDLHSVHLSLYNTNLTAVIFMPHLKVVV